MKKIEHKQEKPNSNTLACSNPIHNYLLPQANMHKHKPNQKQDENKKRNTKKKKNKKIKKSQKEDLKAKIAHRLDF